MEKTIKLNIRMKTLNVKIVEGKIIKVKETLFAIHEGEDSKSLVISECRYGTKIASVSNNDIEALRTKFKKKIKMLKIDDFEMYFKVKAIEKNTIPVNDMRRLERFYEKQNK